MTNLSLKELFVRNVGSLEVKLHQVGAEITSINSEVTYSNELANIFADSMSVKIYESVTNIMLFDGTLTELLTSHECSSKPIIQSTESIALTYEVTMNQSVSDDLQGIKPLVYFWIGAEQGS